MTCVHEEPVFFGEESPLTMAFRDFVQDEGRITNKIFIKSDVFKLNNVIYLKTSTSMNELDIAVLALAK